MLVQFLHSMRNKKFYRVLESFFNDPNSVSDIEVSKALSSYITHALIEAERSDNPALVIFDLHVKDVSYILFRFVAGELSVSDLSNELSKVFSVRV